MELPQAVTSEAERLIEEGAELPVLIQGSTGFYVAEEGDTSILAFGGIKVGGATYKIGIKK